MNETKSPFLHCSLYEDTWTYLLQKILLYILRPFIVINIEQIYKTFNII